MTTQSIKYGVYGGLVGGVVFGAMMGMMGMLTMIGSMVGPPSPWIGFVVHMLISAVIGGTYGLATDALGRHGGIGTGLVYGLMWWVLGPLTLMPAMMGMGIGVNWTLPAMGNALPSLVGHLVYGAILGATFHWCERRTATGAEHGHARAV